MKKLVFLLLLCHTSLFISAQFSAAQFTSASAHKVYQKITPSNDTVYVMFFNGIKPETDIKYTGSGSTVKWFKYSDLSSDISSGNSEIYFLDDAEGYVIDVDGRKASIWVIDYKNYIPALKSIRWDMNATDACRETNLLIDVFSVPKILYKTPTNIVNELVRDFTIKYATQKWDASSQKWNSDSITVESVRLNPSSTSRIPVLAPLIDTEFEISGDQYALDFGIDSVRMKSSIYSAVAVECHLTTVVTERSQKNEASHPESNKSDIRYSAPIDIQFLSNANEPVATFFNWAIYKDDQLIVKRTDRNHRYTFTDYGTYKVKIVASNANCSFTDSVTINAIEAAVQVPNVFTPNGDSYNDEFRIAYKSLLGFECWVYNRWGRKVFYWNDPQKGWDGKINGKDAAEGPYFYVIKATGYGLDPKVKDLKVKSTITLKGDINLLRGKR